MYLIDTDVISEARKRTRANRSVRQFFRQVIKESTPVFLSVITIGERRRGIELLTIAAMVARRRDWRSG